MSDGDPPEEVGPRRRSEANGVPGDALGRVASEPPKGSRRTILLVSLAVTAIVAGPYGILAQAFWLSIGGVVGGVSTHLWLSSRKDQGEEKNTSSTGLLYFCSVTFCGLVSCGSAGHCLFWDFGFFSRVAACIGVNLAMLAASGYVLPLVAESLA
eukprot:TRINITY_DN48540_c0_g1_i1.p2 TRINITY_DN48540_c0_g1~~TRINITY_DN48540_c0_g1_i1.p2  ORF type:complete len:155 (-),score=22.21 TRINITY_DN48540_c0_g1_i1:219-683(-)